MHVQRKWRVAERVSGGKALEIVGGGYAFVELQGGRIARVARPRAVVAGEEVGGNGAINGTRCRAQCRRSVGATDGGVSDSGIHYVCSACTVSIRACTLSREASGVM